jgi:hypothetical protein
MAFVDLRLDGSGDLDLTNGQLSLTPDLQTVIRQKVQITLRAFRGEYFADINLGVPYLENDNNSVQLLGDRIPKDIFDTYMREAILSVDGVVSITEYSSEVNNTGESLTIEFSAQIESGDVISTTDTITL